MPQIKFRGVAVEKVCNISKEMIDDLTEIIGCPRDYFTIEHIPSTFIQDGEITEGYPFVEVLWFDRGQSVQDKTARVITEYLHRAGYEQVDLFFQPLEKHRYYENGEHF
ncbi:protein of unknown function [Geosporobacter subterraneus DSM 17957]|uniref:DUF1904 domain-containing protein n=1 Tax=Geosporobacter subterraneus DSM 17957 TaxID=1121919 RepID=A0A1M6III2_9FIRM|nr:DUF1904 domain-containing protein [Geosporobacter subterraneus]SHJ34183.1 protein of unknown function [Geosporobacter subterraneus DSM 17957]